MPAAISDAATVACVEDAAKLDPLQFYTQFVAQRRPVHLRGPQLDPQLRAIQSWTPASLAAASAAASAGADEQWVRVEVAGSKSRDPDPSSSGSTAVSTYGQGHYKYMRFAEFCRAVDAGEDAYLSAQPMAADDAGRADVLAAPLTTLRSLFPLQPSVTGFLVPAAVNLWMGAAGAESTASGLHCDFHDNLYIVGAGKKTFRLYPPSAARRLPTKGRVSKCDRNGRISFVNHSSQFCDASGRGPWEKKATVAAQIQVQGETEELAEKLLDLELEIDEAERALSPHDFQDLGDGEGAEEGADMPPSFCDEASGSIPWSEALSVTICSGDALYLPVGWFHRVESGADPARKRHFHLALSYWFHPPDSLSPSLYFPYADKQGWPLDWQLRMKIGRLSPPVRRKRERHQAQAAAATTTTTTTTRADASEEKGGCEVEPDFFTVRKIATYWENCIFGCKHFRTKATRILISDI